MKSRKTSYQGKQDGRRIGYARVSTEEQNLDLQLHALEAAGCDLIFDDKGISGAALTRPGLSQAFKTLQPGDTLIVWRLDRLGRSLSHLIHMLEDFGKRGIGFTSLNDPVDTTTASGRLILQVLGALAEFERSLISERTLAGLSAARRRGRTLGRPKKLNGAQLDHARHLIGSKAASKKEVADMFRVSPRTLYRAIKDIEAC
jgi:DNA invertase Pin-like site-specific DNA recombinase